MGIFAFSISECSIYANTDVVFCDVSPLNGNCQHLAVFFWNCEFIMYYCSSILNKIFIIQFYNISSMAATCFVQPLDLVKTRMQMSGKNRQVS